MRRAENEGTEGWPNGIGDIQHNTSPARLCHATGEFEGVVGGVVGRRFVEIDAEVFTKKRQGRPPGGHRAHVGTVHGAKAGEALDEMQIFAVDPLLLPRSCKTSFEVEAGIVGN